MIAVLIFSILLLIAVLLSGLANRSVLSTAVLFLVGGFFCGSGMAGWIGFHPTDTVVLRFAELAIFSVLFTEGMGVSVRNMIEAWRLPGQALLFGLPLTLGATAALAHWIVGLAWPESLLLGALLSPTDPVFAAAIVGQKQVPERLRHLLNVESGLNDGLALPIVIALVSYLRPEDFQAAATLGQIALGIGLGIAIPWLVIRLEGSRFFSAEELYQPLAVFGIGLLLFAAATFTHANEFLAAFAAGVTVAVINARLRDAFDQFGKLLAELFKLAGLLVFGSLISPQFLADMGWQSYLFALLVLVVPRPFALCLSLLGSPLSRREWLTAAWFGPKGFASVFLTLLVLRSGIDSANQLYHLAALVIAASIILHSSSDVVLARWFERTEQAPGEPAGEPAESA